MRTLTVICPKCKSKKVSIIHGKEPKLVCLDCHKESPLDIEKQLKGERK